MKEVEIKGYEGLYSINENGDVFSLEKKNGRGFNLKRIKMHSIIRTGYPAIRLTKDGKRKPFHIHRLLGLHFIPNPENKPQINHINCDKTDFRLSNLEWTTAKENKRHAMANGFQVDNSGEKNGRGKLKESQVLEIRERARKGEPLWGLAYGVSNTTIKDIIYRRSWTHI